MNEPIYKNSYIRNEDIVKAFYKFFCYTSSKQKFASIIIPICLFIIFLDSFPRLTNFYILLVISALVLIIKHITYKKLIKNDIERDRELNNGSFPNIELIVFDDKIVFSSPNSTITLLLENIKEFETTKDFIYLRSKTNLWFEFKKDSFTLGTSEEFIEFLQSKNIKIRK